MIRFPAGISGIKTMADGSLRVQLDTQELPPETMTSIFGAKKKVGLVFFIPEERDLSDNEKDFLDSVTKKLANDESPSKELRNMIWGLFKSTYGADANPDGFEQFYKDSLKIFVNIVRDKIHEANGS